MIQEHSGVHKGRSAEALSHEVPQIKIKTKHTKRKCRFLRGESLQCSVLKPGARSNCSSCFKPGQHFLLFKSPRFWDWNLVHGTHSLLLLEKGFLSLSVPQTAPPSRAKAGQKYFKLQNFLCSSLFPHTQTGKYSNIRYPPNHKVCEYAFLLLLFSLSLGHCS